MKPVSIIVGALAALATAAPTTAPKEIEARTFDFNAGAFNNFAFANQDLAYLNVLNQLQFQNLHGLAINNGLNLNGFQNLFVQQVFDVNAAVQIAQLQLLSQLSVTGIFGGFDLSTLALQQFDFGLLNVGGFGLNQFIPQANLGQIAQISQKQAGLNGLLGLNGFNNLNLGNNLGNNLNLGSNVNSGVNSNVDASGLDIVTAAEEEIQDGGASLPQ